MTHLDGSNALCHLQDEAIDVRVRPGVGRHLLHNEGIHAAKTRQVETVWLVERPIGHPVGKPAADIAPHGVLLHPVVTEDHIEAGYPGLFPQALRFRRWILPIVVQVDDVGAARVAPAGQHGIVLAKIARMLHERDRHLRPVHQPAHDLAGTVATAVVHQDDLVTALNVQRLDVADHGGNRLGALVERDHEGKGECGHGETGTLGRASISSALFEHPVDRDKRDGAAERIERTLLRDLTGG